MTTRRAGWLALCAAALLAGCAVPVTGSGVAAPGLASANPCSLLTPQDATGAGLRETGKYQAPQPKLLIPHGCEWDLAADGGPMKSVSLVIGVTIKMIDYVNGRDASSRFDAGGRSWKQYGTGQKSDLSCDAGVEVQQGSVFVVIQSFDMDDPVKACETLKVVAAAVAPKLPPP